MLRDESHLVEWDSIDRSLHPGVADTGGHVHPGELDLASGPFEQYFNSLNNILTLSTLFCFCVVNVLNNIKWILPFLTSALAHGMHSLAQCRLQR